MNDYERQAKLFKTLMHPARLAILENLGHEEACVCHLEAILHQRQAYISQQLMVLREADLFDMRREGWNVYYRLADARVLPVLAAARAAVGATLPGGPGEAPNCSCPKCTTEPAVWEAGPPARQAAMIKE
jgi:DNA-binding transcriptional ArsR family regulator